MKKMKQLATGLIVFVLFFNSCMPDNVDKEKIQKVFIKESLNKSSVCVYTFTVHARNWETINATEKSIDIPVSSITEEIINNGTVMMYLMEGDKNIALPFNYYQVRRILSFQPSYENGHAYITIFGNFILNINEYYHFKLIVVPNKIVAKNKILNWKNYSDVKKAFKIEE